MTIISYRKAPICMISKRRDNKIRINKLEGLRMIANYKIFGPANLRTQESIN